jgi:bleomycin hydrolase
MMKRFFVPIGLVVALSLGGQAQNVSTGKIITEVKGKGFYTESILKDVKDVEEKLEEKAPYLRFVMDQSGIDLPNDPSLYKTVWSNPTESQGNAGTCWSFSTTSFYESEVLRQHGKKVEISEIYSAYFEYVEKARTRNVPERRRQSLEKRCPRKRRQPGFSSSRRSSVRRRKRFTHPMLVALLVCLPSAKARARKLT